MIKRNLTETRFGKFFLWGVVAFLCILALAGAAFGHRLWRSMRSDEPPSVVRAFVYAPSAQPVLGSVFNAEAILRAPWGKTPRGAVVDPGAGIQLAAEPEWSRVGHSWGYSDWLLRAPLQGYRIGKSGEGKAEASFPDGTLSLALPPVEVASPPESETDELLLAPKLTPPEKTASKTPFWIWGIAALLIVAAVVVFLLVVRRKKTAVRREAPVWDRTLDAIRGLLARMKAGELSSEHAVSELTDIVRRYLESRFQLRATRQTTTEFLRALGRDEGILSEQDRKFLRSFLESADMVKFARLPAEPDSLENATHRAEALVLASIPKNQEKGARQ